MRYVALAGRIIAGLLGIAILTMSIVALPYTVKAARGQGIHGTFTAERQSCSRGCSTYGTWRADPPNNQVLTDVLMDEWPSDQPIGSSVDALYLEETDPLVVYRAGETFSWLYALVGAGGAVVVLWVAVAGVREFRDARRLARRSEGYEPRRVRHELDP